MDAIMQSITIALEIGEHIPAWIGYALMAITFIFLPAALMIHAEIREEQR